MKLQQYFKSQSSLVTLYECKLKMLRASEGDSAMSISQREQIEKEVKEMEGICFSTSFPGSFFGEGKTLVGAGHVPPRIWVVN